MIAALRACLELGKLRLSALAVFSVVAGAFMALPPKADLDPVVVVATALGTMLVAAGSSALNMYREREFDRHMERTRGRPLPSGRLSPRTALVCGLVMAAVGLILLAVFTTWLATLLCAGILLSYVLVYTPMKRVTPLNTLVGAIPGGLPPVVGYAAMLDDPRSPGHLGMPALVLFAILFCWQIPHFLAIAWRYRDDYERGGFRMLPQVDPSGERTRLTMLLYSAGLGIASLLPFVTQLAGQVYLGAAVCLDLLFCTVTAIAAITRYESAMRLTFLTSIAYLPLLLLVMVLDRWPG